MTREEIYDKVNRCETFDELADVILAISEDGRIQGRTRDFDALKMAKVCRNFKDYDFPNLLTREFGIRQQALYISYYTK